MQVSSTNGSSKSSLPIELIFTILELSASSSSTQHARNICLVSRLVYDHCWPSLYRIIALRNAKQLKEFSEYIYQPDLSEEKDKELYDRLKRKQEAIRCLYLNNNKDASGLKELTTDERPDMWMMSTLLAARKLQLLHVEEYWSVSYPWEPQEEKPLLAYPLMLLSSFPAALHTAFVALPKSQWVHRLFSHRWSPTKGIFEDIITLQLSESSRRNEITKLIPQPQEVTLSALAMSASHLHPSPQSASTGLPPNSNAFERLTRFHLYFAKMDPLLVDTLIDMPKLTHLRLTRPFSENLSDAVFQLLGGGEEGTSKIKSLIVEAGIYMDQRTMSRLRELQDSPLGQGRLRFIDSFMYQHGPYKPAEAETLEQSSDESSTTHVINWVTSSEERGFAQFSERAGGGDGVWSE